MSDNQNYSAFNQSVQKIIEKINNLETTQKAIVTKVDAVHEAIYDPDEGLFSRLKTEQHSIERNHLEMLAWREHVDNNHIKDAETEKEILTQLSHHANEIKTLRNFQNKSTSFLRWVAVALGGGAVSLLFHWLSTLISS